MAVKDNHSNTVVVKGMDTSIVASTTTLGEIIDTADFDDGIKYAIDVPSYQDGDYAFSFEEGDDPALADATAVPVEKVIGGALTLSQVIGGTGFWPSRGVISIKRFVRLVVTSFNVTNGAAIYVLVVQSGEYNPQFQDGP